MPTQLKKVSIRRRNDRSFGETVRFFSISEEESPRSEEESPRGGGKGPKGSTMPNNS